MSEDGTLYRLAADRGRGASPLAPDARAGARAELEAGAADAPAPGEAALAAAAFEASPDLLATLRPDGTVLAANRAWRARLGAGGRLADLVEAEDGPAALRLLDCGARGRGGVAILRLPGGDVPIRIEFRVVSGEGGLLHLSGRDVTERDRRAEAAIADSRRLGRLVAVAGTGGWEVDPARGRVALDATAGDLLGLHPGEASLEDLAGRFRLDARAGLQAAIAGAAEARRPFDLELPLKGGTGVVRWLRVAGEADVERGRVSGAMEDITARKTREIENLRLRERFEAVFDHSEAAMFLRNRSGVYLRANRRWRSLTGIVDPAGLRIEDVHGPEAAEILREHDRQVFEARRSFFGEERMRGADGEERVFLSSKFLVSDAAEGDLVLCCVSTDVTELRRREAQLAAMRARFEAVVEHAAAPIFLKRRDGRFLLCNAALRAKLGRDPTGLTTADLYPPEVAAPIQANDRRVFETGEPFNGEERSFDGQGRERVSLLTKFLIDDPELGEPVLCALASDVTEARRRERALELGRQRFEAMFENTDALMFVKRRDGRFIAANRRFLERLGDLKSAVGLTDYDIHPPQVADGLCAADQAIFESGARVWGEEVTEDPDGATRHWLSSKFLAPDPDLDEMVLFCVSVEITEQKRLQASLEESRRSAEAASQAKSRFLAMMSHEIRTPLNGVLGMAELLSKKVDREDQRRMLDVIRNSGLSLMHLLNDALDSAKIESGRMVLERASFSPGELVRCVAEFHRARAEQKGLALEVAVEPSAERERVGDEHRIGQILQNLLGNAVKFTERGRVRVEARGGDGVTLVVEDDGVGMSEAEQAVVFEEFAQADSSVTRRFGGTGLGLSIVRGLVRAMEGCIELDSAPGRGARFTVTLPLPASPEPPDGKRRGPIAGELAAAPRPAAPAARAPAELARAPVAAEREGGLEARRERAPAPEPVAWRSGDRGRALVADDNEVNRMVLGALLATLGWTTVSAEGGLEAVAAAEEDDLDLLFIDISMPDLDGVQALRRIRERERARGAARRPAVACTANAMPHQVAAYLAAGFEGHLAKPLSRDTVRATLERHAPQRRAPLGEAASA